MKKLMVGGEKETCDLGTMSYEIMTRKDKPTERGHIGKQAE